MGSIWGRAYASLALGAAPIKASYGSQRAVSALSTLRFGRERATTSSVRREFHEAARHPPASVREVLAALRLSFD